MKKGSDKILLAHGGGGQLSDELIRHYILPRFKNDALAELADSAKLNLSSGSICFTTDSYVVKPLFFNGGDIGKLAVCGTINDLAVAGAVPAVLSLSLIIEEGFEFELLEKILASVSETARENDVDIVTGDIKTVEAGAADKIFINTAGIGTRLKGVDLGYSRIAAGDKIIINGTIGDHGMTIISQREGIKFQSKLKSDCASVAKLVQQLLDDSGRIKFMRDPTRGGLAGTLNEICRGSGLSIEINEADIPINPTVQAAADMLGFDVLNIANEGKLVAIVSAKSADDCLKICKKTKLGKEARVIGKVIETSDIPTVEMVTKISGRRIVQMPYGARTAEDMLMHETMVAESILKTITAEGKKQKAKPLSVKISCGTLNAINDEILCFAFGAIAKGTPCEGIKLKIEHKQIQGKCRNCDETFDFELCRAKCPKCESEEFDLLPDAPLILEEIEFETE